MPLTRTEARKHYKALVPTPMPKEGELLADSELARILTKLPHEGDPHVNDHDCDMSDFMINQINSCFTQAEDFIYEVMSGTKKLLLDVHGSLIPYERNSYDTSNQPYLYRLLPQAKIALVDFAAMESTLGIDHIPYGSETAYQEPKAAPASSAKAPRKLQGHRATVERLFERGVIRTQAQPELLELKAIFDDQIKIATEEKQRIPFAISQRILNAYINRWTAISRALEVISRPYNPYGKAIVNAPFELDERKRKADKSSLTASSPSVKATEEADEERQDDNMDRLNPEGDGGNSV
jgi:hypothetical protein